ncbi:MAG TPA: DUF4202 domain-containing protein [Microthrixaceae bacterium]|nr:DUF4202 domain-containing protein [Microthrixaceae bacterium]
MSRSEGGTDRLVAAIAAIDAANAEDPIVVRVGGERGPKELVHSRRATDWLERLVEDPTEEQLIAIRAHHFRRWARPRSDFPDGRAGYLKWRTEAKKAHAVEVGELLAGVGYEPALVDRVASIIRKERLASDPAVQAHEDALCLVFLEAQLDDLAGQLGDDHTIEVLVKTMRKMSPAGLELATGIPLSEESAALLRRALEELAAAG